MTEAQMIDTLRGTKKGQLLFVSYVAGRAATDESMESARRAMDAGFAKRHFVGTFEKMWVARNGDTVFTICAFNRDSFEYGVPVEGAFRTMNPCLGKLYMIATL
jgi:hypothetical protein